jgi:hypothetical protein
MRLGAVQVLSGESLLALVTTPSRLYVFLGGPGLTGLFSGYASRSVGAQDTLTSDCLGPAGNTSALITCHEGVHLEPG